MSQKVFMFSGQGSQYYQMGRELFDNVESFRKSMLFFETLMKEYAGLSLLDVIYDAEKKYEDFDEIRFTHPALYAIQISLVRLLNEHGIFPDQVMGYSLGEYVAGAVANVYKVEDGMKMLIEQSHKLAQSQLNGGMMVILESIENIERAGLLRSVEVAAENYPGNFTVSGRLNDLHSLRDSLQKKYIYAEILPIRYPFHSTHIDPFREEFRDRLKFFRLGTPDIPFYSCTTAEQLLNVSADHLWNVVRNPILFNSLIQKLIVNDDLVFIDLGPSGSLCSFMKYAYGDKISVFSTINRYGKDLKTLDQLLESIRSIEEPIR